MKVGPGMATDSDLQLWIVLPACYGGSGHSGEEVEGAVGPPSLRYATCVARLPLQGEHPPLGCFRRARWNEGSESDLFAWDGKVGLSVCVCVWGVLLGPSREPSTLFWQWNRKFKNCRLRIFWSKSRLLEARCH